MPDSKKIERKHFFINRKLQGHYMITFLVPMMVILLFMLVALYLAANTIMHNVANIIREDVQNIISLNSPDDSKLSIEAYKTSINDINRYILDFSQNKRYRNVVTTSFFYVLGIGLFLVIIQIVLLTKFYSHRIAGPIYRFEMACHHIIEGRYSDCITLRKGDEMKNLAHLFNEATEITRKRFQDLKNTQSGADQGKIFDSLQL